MKPFFGIDITDDKKNETMNAEPFVVAKPSAASALKIEREIEEVISEMKANYKHAGKHGWKSNVLVWCAAIFAFVALFAVEFAVDVTLDVKKVAAVLLCWGVAAVFVGVDLLLWRLSRKTDRAAEWADDAPKPRGRKDAGADKGDVPPSSAASEIFAELRVPKTAKSVDVVGFKYREKRGRIRPRGRGGVNGVTVYPLFTFKGYVKDDALCFACTDEGVYAVPLSGIRAIRTVDKRLYLPCWTKGASLAHEKYKPYKLKTVRGRVDENLRVGWYHVLEFVHNGETWGIWFPNYELPFFEKATGLKADEESTNCKELFTSSPEI